MNLVCISGRLTKDIEIRQAGETTVGRFTLAVNRQTKKETEADFISCVVFGKTAEAMSKWTGKGLRLAVVGHIQTGSYVKQDGSKVYTTDVIVDRADYIDFKENNNPHQVKPQGTEQQMQWRQQWTQGEQQPQQGYQAQPQQPSQYQQAQWQQAAQEGFMQPDPLSDEGLPFGN